MAIASSIRSVVRKIIDKYGKSASYYSYSEATVTYNDEGDETISWGSVYSIKVISSNNNRFKTLFEMQGIENDKSGRKFILRDDIGITPTQGDKIVVGSDSYIVTEVNAIDPIEDNIVIAYRILVREA